MKQFLLFCTLISSVYASAQGGFLARPTKVYFNTTPAAVQKQFIEVRNTSDEPLLLNLSLQDWTRDSLGNKQYGRPGSQPTSCSRYMKLSDEALNLQPGESKNIELQLTAPPDSLKHALNAMLMVTQAAEKGADKSQAVSAQFVMQMRIGIHIYFQPPYLQERKVELQKLFFAQSGSASKEDLLAKENGLISEIENQGQTVEEGKIKLELVHDQTGETFTIAEKQFNSMPGDRLQIPFTLPTKLPKGSYAVTAMLDIGLDAPLKVMEAEIALK